MSILDKFSLKDKVIVITGGTGILGKSFVHALAEAGAKVCIIGRSQDKIDERVAQVEALGAEALGVVCDVMNEGSVQEAKERILQHWERLTAL